jgi:O-antigen/teichoic acid export membrane protein
MLERALNFRRLRILGAISTALYAITMLALGLAGLGALAIVLSSLTGGLAPAFDLVFVRRWRPRPGWWQNPNWRSYRPSLRFGALNIASNVLSSARSALEFAVLPARAGFVAIGLWSRAQALFTMSIGRLMTVLQQTVYPLLPRYAAHRERYPRQATLFAQVMIWLLVPSAIYLGLEGKALSRILYGSKWVGADPMIWPAVVFGLGLWIFMISGTVNVAANRLRICLKMDAFAAGMSLPALAVAWYGGGIVAYAWGFAVGQLLVGLLNFANAAQFVHNRWTTRVLLPTALSTTIGAAGVIAIHLLGFRLTFEVLVTAIVFPVLVLVAFRLFFMEDLREVLMRLPGGSQLRRVMWMEPQPVLPTV